MAAKETDKTRTVVRLLKHITEVEGHPAGIHSHNYQNQFSADEDAARRRPMVKDMLSDSTDALQDVNEAAIIAQAGLFEQFVQCWFLNMTLAILEGDSNSLSRAHQNVLASSCPFAREKFPSITKIISAFPDIHDQLLRLPRMKLDRRTGKSLAVEANPMLSAWAAIEFWREYRNLVVHQGAFVTTRFLQRNKQFFDIALKPYFRSDLKLGRRLPIGDQIYGAMATAHYLVADLMNKHLEEISGGRRGHPEAPGEKTREDWPKPPTSPRMLMNNDHAISLAWAADKYQTLKIAGEREWTLDPLYEPRRYRTIAHPGNVDRAEPPQPRQRP